MRKKIRQIATEGHPTTYVISTLKVIKNKSEKLSQSSRGKEEMMTKFNSGTEKKLCKNRKYE